MILSGTRDGILQSEVRTMLVVAHLMLHLWNVTLVPVLSIRHPDGTCLFYGIGQSEQFVLGVTMRRWAYRAGPNQARACQSLPAPFATLTGGAMGTGQE